MITQVAWDHGEGATAAHKAAARQARFGREKGISLGVNVITVTLRERFFKPRNESLTHYSPHFFSADPIARVLRVTGK